MVVGYDCEGLRYDGAYFMEKHHYKGQSQINHHIKLANDGFLYKTAMTVEVGPIEEPSSCPRSQSWHSLSTQDIEEFLESILTYANDFFQAAYKFTLYYNVGKERIDFVAHIPTDKLVITFGPGYPNDDNDTIGLWGLRKLPLQVS